MIFKYIVCSAQLSPIRTAPSHDAQMSSQLLFGERAIVMKQEGDWLYIECWWDQYEGWIHQGAVQFITFKQIKKPNKTIASIGLNKLKFDDDGACLLSPGSDLFGIKSSSFYWLEDEDIKYKGSKISLKNVKIKEGLIEKYAMHFLGTAYVWGGRSQMGIDCSGLAQIVYKLLNIKLPRDAAEQAQKGETVSFLQEAVCGDLAFFDDEEGLITHVGILLNNHTIIHASQKSGGVVIDAIDQGGIISKKLKRRTNKLRIVKRYF